MRDALSWHVHNVALMVARAAARIYRDRRAALIENDDVRLIVLEEGGHIAEVFDKRAGVNPLWTPPWPSIEPSAFDARVHTSYGNGADARLLAGLMGHNLCLDIFGVPSAEEAAAGLTAHGEASIARYDIDIDGQAMTMRAKLPLAELAIERRIELHGRAVRIHETAVNLAGIDRPVGWTEHITLGPPFLQKGVTEFRVSAAQSKVYEGDFGVADYLCRGAEFGWPHAPRVDGGTADLRCFTSADTSSAYTAHLMDTTRDDAFFVAFSPPIRLAFGCVWRRSDFPWMGIWEENHSRAASPWNSRTLTRGMEFGVSPFPESRRQMVDRGALFGTRTYRWLPAKGRATVEYWALTLTVERVPETLEWP
jgi:hypothetical protein